MRFGWAQISNVTRTFGWTATDQVLSALSNLLVGLAVARGGGASALGEFQLAFATGIIVIGFLRQLITEPLLSLRPQDPLAAHQAALSSTLLYALPLSACSLLLGAITDTDYFLALGPAIVALCVQDTTRYVCFHRSLARHASMVDGVWLATSAAFWPALVASGDPSFGIAVWGAGAALGAGLGLWRLRIAPSRLKKAIGWWRSQVGAFGSYLAAAGVAFTLGSQGVTYGIAALLGTDELGRLRAALIVLGPVLMIQTAVGLVGVPRLAGRAWELSRRRTTVLALATGAIGLLAVLPIILLRGPLTSLFFADKIDLPADLLIPLAIHVVVTLVGSFYLTLMRADQRGRDVLVAHALTYGFGGVIIVFASASGDLRVAGWAFVAQAVMLVVSGVHLWERNRPRTRSASKAHA